MGLTSVSNQGFPLDTRESGLNPGSLVLVSPKTRADSMHKMRSVCDAQP